MHKIEYQKIVPMISKTFIKEKDSNILFTSAVKIGFTPCSVASADRNVVALTHSSLIADIHHHILFKGTSVLGGGSRNRHRLFAVS